MDPMVRFVYWREVHPPYRAFQCLASAIVPGGSAMCSIGGCEVAKARHRASIAWERGRQPGTALTDTDPDCAYLAPPGSSASR